MTSIGGPGGIGGPKGPDGPSGPDAADDVADVTDVRGDAGVESARAAGGLEAMAADIAAGRMTANEAVEKLVDEIAGSDGLGSTERAELREMLTDLVANDPYLSSLVGRA